MASKYTNRQINVDGGVWRNFNVKLAELGLKKKDFAIDMLNFFHEKQDFIHKRKRRPFSYPQSIPKSEPHEIYQMKFTESMMKQLTECVDKAKEAFPDEVDTLSERRVLKAMFEEYFDFLVREKR